MTVGRLTGAAAVFAIAGLLAAGAAAEASPVTYDFSGTFSQPVFGSTSFSGTITYDTSLPPYPGAAQDATHAYYADGNGTPIGMSLILGTTWGNPLGTQANGELAITHTSANDSLNLDATYRSPTTGQYSNVVLGLLNDNTTSPGPFTSLNPPTSLDLRDFNLGAQLIINPSGGSTGPVIGTITSLNATTVPEPAALVLFAALAAGLARRRASRRG